MARKVLLDGGYFLSAATKQVVIQRVVPLERIILITNLTSGKVIYNFSDASLRSTAIAYNPEGGLTASITGASTSGTAITFTANNTFTPGQFATISGVTPASFNVINAQIISATPTTFTIASPVTGAYVSGGNVSISENTVITLNYNTAAMGNYDEIQIVIDELNERFNPSEELTDPVGKLRTSTPQALIDTDFEYGPQVSKWENLGLTNNRPFAYAYNFNALSIADIQTSTAGTKSITVSLTNSTVATTSTGVQGNGTTATYTTASVHGLSVGQYVTVTGITPAGYNTTSGYPQQILSVPSPTTFILATTTTGQSTGAGTVTSNVAPPVGTPIQVFDTFSPTVQGNYVIETRPGETSFTFSAKGSTPTGWASTSVFDANKTLVTAATFYTGAALNASALTASFSGQAITVTTPQPHGLSIGNEIAVVGMTASTNAPNGNFYVSSVTNPTTFVYYAAAAPTGTLGVSVTGLTGTAAASTNLLTLNTTSASIFVGMGVSGAGIPVGTIVTSYQSGTSTGIVILSQDVTAALSATALTFYPTVYARSQAQVQHRAFDGGVFFSTNGTSNNVSQVRQTRRYFRYQSGKGIAISSGTILKPSFGIDSLTYSAPYVTVQTKEKHGLQPGYQVTVYGANENGYNGTFAVVSVTSLNTFTYTPVSAPTITPASGNYYVAVSAWNGASSRLGLFDQQNGVFFEHDGTQLYAVRRSSVFQIAGRVTVTNGSSTITQTGVNYPTSFSKQLVPGDFIVLRGQSYKVTDIASDTSLTIQPAYRGNTATNVIVSKTVDTRIPQSAWNIDPLNGSGPSEYNLDMTKMQMFYIDYSWYGAGAVRWGFRTNKGNIIYAHKLANNNANATAYMRSGNLSGRYESVTAPATTTITASVGAADATINVGNTAGFYKPTVVTTTASGSAASATITVGSTAGITVGMFVNATNITAGSTVVAAVSPTTVTLSYLPTGTVSGSITFSTYPGTATIRSGSTYEMINYTGITSNTLTGVTRAAAGSASLALTIAVGSNVATVASATGLQVGQRIVSPAFADGTKIEYLQGLTLVLSSSPTTANPTVIVPPMGATSGQAFTYSATAPIVVEQAFPTYGPSISHWGTSVIMDGRFDDDKSLLFTYGQTTPTLLAPSSGTTATGTASASATVTLGATNTNIVPGMYVVDAGTAVPRGTYVVSVTSPTVVVLSQAVTLSATALTFYGAATKALMSIRIAPSVDNGFSAAFGARELLNKMQLQTKALDISLLGASGNVLVQAYLNGVPFNPTGTNTSTVWTNAVRNAVLTPNSSLAQIADYAGGNVIMQGGEVTGGFFTNSTGSIDLSQVRDLGNAVLAGGSAYANTQVYPDGPDTLTIVVTNVGTTAQSVLGRISWTEAQA
jgi:hypothetical protein